MEVTQEWISKQKLQLNLENEKVPDWLSYKQIERWQSSLVQVFEKLSLERAVNKTTPPKLYWLHKELMLQENILKNKALYELGQVQNQLIIQKIINIQENLPKSVLDEIAREEKQRLEIEEELKEKSKINQLKWDEFQDHINKINEIDNQIVRCEIGLNTIEASRSVAQEFEGSGRLMSKGNGHLRSNKFFGIMGIEKLKKIRDSLIDEEKNLKINLEDMKEALLFVSDPIKRGKMGVVDDSDLLCKSKNDFQECESRFIKATEIYQKLFS